MHEILSNLPWYWKVGFTALMILMTWPMLRAFVRSKRELPRKPSTPRPSCPPAPARRRPLQVDEDFWLPTHPSSGAIGATCYPGPVASGIPREAVEWKCEYCGGVNRDVATCCHCGAPCTVSEKVEKVKQIGRVGGCPFPPPE